jgi:hypothetical protein
MAMKRPVSWFLTETGRKFSFAFITGSGITFTAAKFAPHTFLLEKYKEIVHYYRFPYFLFILCDLLLEFLFT